MKLFAALAVIALSFSAHANSLSAQGQKAAAMLESHLGRALTDTELNDLAQSEQASLPAQSLSGSPSAAMETNDGRTTSRLYCLKANAGFGVSGALGVCAGESGLHTVYGIGGFGFEASLTGAVLIANLPGSCSISQSFVRPVGLSVTYYGGVTAVRFRETESYECSGHLDVFGLNAGFGGTMNAGPKDMMGLTID